MFAGYSAASPSLWTMAGYDGMVIRFEGPPEMRAEWERKQLFEFLWEPSAVFWFYYKTKKELSNKGTNTWPQRGQIIQFIVPFPVYLFSYFK